jgi:hypothetical protein
MPGANTKERPLEAKPPAGAQLSVLDDPHDVLPHAGANIALNRFAPQRSQQRLTRLKLVNELPALGTGGEMRRRALGLLLRQIALDMERK